LAEQEEVGLAVTEATCALSSLLGETANRLDNQHGTALNSQYGP
jgi:hypothetical protein